MDSWGCTIFSGGAVNTLIFFISLSTTLLSIYLAGCSDQVQLPSAEQVTKFENALSIRTPWLCTM